MSQTDLSEFDDRLNSGECSQIIRDIVACLREAAGRVGGIWRSAHSALERSWGIVGMRGGRVVCRLDIKPYAGHVCVSIPGADDRQIVAAGAVHCRKNAPSWVDVRDVKGAGRIAPLIAAACAEMAEGANPMKP